ncbi:hypothetical protein VTK73DRAFT_9745 [Phialemonium thermophilum]|uniref:Uncharacterized protein n=1 Tax=Phialemonium thermophilum TaxID=223376 RepID=A0ABR3W0Q2_9PEZI
MAWLPVPIPVPTKGHVVESCGVLLGGCSSVIQGWSHQPLQEHASPANAGCYRSSSFRAGNASLVVPFLFLFLFLFFFWSYLQIVRHPKHSPSSKSRSDPSSAGRKVSTNVGGPRLGRVVPCPAPAVRLAGPCFCSADSWGGHRPRARSCAPWLGIPTQTPVPPPSKGAGEGDRFLRGEAVWLTASTPKHIHPSPGRETCGTASQ